MRLEHWHFVLLFQAAPKLVFLVAVLVTCIPGVMLVAVIETARDIVLVKQQQSLRVAVEHVIVPVRLEEKAAKKENGKKNPGVVANGRVARRFCRNDDGFTVARIMFYCRNE